MYEHYAGFFALYYSLSFSCYFAKIFSMATSFRMTSFAPREAMTTAEPPEPLDFQHPEFIFFKQILQRIDGPAARLFGVFCVFCGLKLVSISVHSWLLLNGLVAA